MSEQMRFFGYSICLGGMIGMLLDVFSGFGRNRKRVYRFWLDVAFGPLAAILLFLGSLVIIDGQLHPLLLLGALLGAVLEHVTIGVYLSKFVVFLRKIVRKFITIFGKVLSFCACLAAKLRAFCRGTVQKCEK